MSTSLSRAECKKHLLLFSASTPLGAIASYAFFTFFESRQADNVGLAMLISVSFFFVKVSRTVRLRMRNFRPEVFSMWRLCYSQSPMIARRRKRLARRRAFFSSCWGSLPPFCWAHYLITVTTTARLLLRHDTVGSSHHYLGCSSRCSGI